LTLNRRARRPPEPHLCSQPGTELSRRLDSCVAIGNTLDGESLTTLALRNSSDRSRVEGQVGMRFRVLGPLEVWDGHGWAGVPAGKQRSLLAVLLLKANQLLSVDWLIEELWAQQPPAGATNQLQVYVSRLRRRLDDRDGLVLVTQAPGYRLVVGADALDLQRFEELVAGGQRALREGALERAAGSLGQALGLWRGQALADVPPGPLVDTEAARLQERRLLAVEDLVEVELGLGRHGGLVSQLQGLVAEQPLRERLWGQLLVALYRSGRQAEALAAYQQLRGRLVGELGIEPCAELQRLQRQILTADPALEVQPQVVPRPGRAAGPADIGKQWPIATPTPTPIPRQLPSDAAAFTGREAELDWLDTEVGTAGPARPVVISALDGTGGIGKSALAIHAAHRLAAADRFPDGQLYVDLRGASDGLAPLAPLEVLGRFLRMLGTAPAAIPGELEEAAARFRSLAAGRRLLVVLDNARDAFQVAPLLPGAPGCGVLVTSRQVLAGLDGAHHLHLDVLSDEEAIVLLGRLAGQQRIAAEPAAAAEVTRWCGYLPLALRIAGARLAARPGWPVRALADRLADAQHRLDELELADRGVRASFAVSYQHLGEGADPVDRQAAGAFPLLGLLDGPDVGVAAATRLLDRSVGETERVLERLVDAQLLQTPAPRRYRFHDLLRLFAREQAQAGGDESARQAALERALDWYLAGAEHADGFLMPAGLRPGGTVDRAGLRFEDRTGALGWLEAERANLVAAARQAATHPEASIARVAWQLSDTLWPFLELRSHWADWQTICRAAVQAAQRAGNLPARARALAHLGSLHGRQRRYQDAMECLQRSLAVCRQVGDRWTEGMVLNNLGNVHREQGRYQEALGCYQQSLALFRAVGDRHCEGKVLNNLGEVYREQGRYQEALGCYQQDLAICRELGDARGEAITLENFGHLHLEQGRDQQAVGCYQQALVICLRIGDRFEEARALQGLGHAVAAEQGPQAARAHWTAALGIFEDLGAPDADEIRGLLPDQHALPQN
jgi:DNA-binding SARP family transcriptional activator/tetratricopeptide (TPR) repeat protein